MNTLLARFFQHIEANGFADVPGVCANVVDGAIVATFPAGYESLGAALVASFDTSVEAQSSWEVAQTRAAALGVLASNDAIPVSVRVFIRDLYTQLNDVREAIGLPRILEPEILGRIVPALQSGLGEF